MLVVLHDVTQQRKAEERRREFVANVSHELRTPLTNIRSYAETIRDAGDELPREREAGSVAAHLIAAQRGAHILRVHDVAATVDALKVWNAVAAVPAPRRDAPASAGIRWPDDD